MHELLDLMDVWTYRFFSRTSVWMDGMEGCPWRGHMTVQKPPGEPGSEVSAGHLLTPEERKQRKRWGATKRKEKRRERVKHTALVLGLGHVGLGGGCGVCDGGHEDGGGCGGGG